MVSTYVSICIHSASVLTILLNQTSIRVLCQSLYTHNANFEYRYFEGFDLFSSSLHTQQIYKHASRKKRKKKIKN